MQKVYLILGASSDVAKEVIKQLDNDSSKEEPILIYAHYYSNCEKLKELEATLKNTKLQYIQADLSNKEDLEEIILHIRKTGILPTHIIHLAALPFTYMKLKKWDSSIVEREMAIGLYSFAEICREYLPEMAKKHYGKVVLMLSSYTLSTPPKYMSNYISVKYAMLGFMKSVAIEYAEKGININAISPNMMETQFLSNVDERVIEMTAQNSIMKRNITTEETAKGILFLLSDASNYMNGVNLNFSGGDIML